MDDRHEGGTHHLDDHQRAIVAMQVDVFVEILSKRYGVEPADVIEAVRFFKDRKRTMENFKHGSAITLLGIVASALALSLWEGIKAAVWKH